MAEDLTPPWMLARPPEPQTAPTTAPPPQQVPVNMPPAPTQNMAFRIPVLGTILDTGRDLLVGPGSDNLTTQEQITRAILNSIVLAKAPQALGDIHANNALRDRNALGTLADPQFQAYATEYAKRMPEDQAIQMAARTARLSSGYALPTSLAQLPPVDPAAAVAFRSKTDLANRVATLSDPDRIPPSVGPYISRDEVREAELAPYLGLPDNPGGAKIRGSIAAQAEKNIHMPGEPIWDAQSGQWVSAISGLPMQASGVVPTTPPSTVPGQPSMPGASPQPIAPPTLDPNGQTQTPPEDRRILGSLGRPVVDPDTGVPRHEIIPSFDDRTGAVTFKMVAKSDEKYKADVEAKRKGQTDFFANLDAEYAKDIENSSKLRYEAEKVANDANVLVRNLLKFVRDPAPDGNPMGTPHTRVFAVDQMHEPDLLGAVGAVGNQLKQKFRASTMGQTFKGNKDIALFTGDRGVAAQMLARVITRDRVSEQDFLTFAEKLPKVGDPRELAEAKILALPAVINDIYQSTLANEDAVRAAVGSRRRERYDNPDPLYAPYPGTTLPANPRGLPAPRRATEVPAAPTVDPERAQRLEAFKNRFKKKE